MFEIVLKINKPADSRGIRLWHMCVMGRDLLYSMQMNMHNIARDGREIIFQRFNRALNAHCVLAKV